ncbi:MAG TPA: methylmalonyl-CoA epimerase [Longimicrobiales bacterium]|nr:methylmalonyl-CoA epimerase [Longimicrobiales bacterium]
MDTSPFPLDHVAIAVPSIDDVMPFWERITNAHGTAAELVESQGVRVAFVGTGSARLELIEPASSDSTVARFIERRGAGLHHVAYRVPDIVVALADFVALGMQPIDRQPRPGAAGHRVAFLHPKDAGGVLVELVEVPHSTAGA